MHSCCLCCLMKPAPHKFIQNFISLTHFRFLQIAKRMCKTQTKSRRLIWNFISHFSLHIYQARLKIQKIASCFTNLPMISTLFMPQNWLHRKCPVFQTDARKQTEASYVSKQSAFSTTLPWLVQSQVHLANCVKFFSHC